MFRRRFLALAALVAASLLLVPGTARAQFRYPLGGFGYGNAMYGPAGFGNPYFYNSPFGFGGWGGFGYGGPGFGYGGFGVPFGVGGYGTYASMYRPITGMSGYGSYYSPMNLGSLAASGTYYYPDYVFANGATLYPNGLSPTALAYLPYASALAANPSGLRTSTGFPAVTPALDMVGPYVPRVRASMSPAVAVTPGSNLFGNNVVTPAAYGATSDKAAHLEVVLPKADAKVFFQGKPTKRTGKVREFDSPPLTAGATFAYEVRATWMDGDEEVSQTRTVPVRAGERVRVDFTSPSKKSK
jgi:uncharacterized protein (TIGR03000 family)